jgi:hypothetical protein
MKNNNRIISVLAAVALVFMAALSSCSSENTVESVDNMNQVVKFNIAKAYAEDTMTRAGKTPVTQRVILDDGLLVDAELSDVSHAANTRATKTDVDITSGKGMAFVCNSSGVILLSQNIEVGTDHTITVKLPGTETYTIYMYLNEDGNLSLSNITMPASNNISDVVIGSRSVGSKDDFAKVSDISASAGTLGSPVTFTPLGCEVMFTINAGVVPISAFNTVLSGIQSSEATNVHVSDGSYTPSGTGGDIEFSNDISKNDPKYAVSLQSSNGYQAFFSSDIVNAQKATLTIKSISGPDGDESKDGPVEKTYQSNNQMKFKSTLYQNGHRYNLILNLATPIYGQVEVTNGVSTGKMTTSSPSNKLPTWPCLNGLALFYQWDALEKYNPGVYHFTGSTDKKATHSCKACITFNQALWYMSAGYYWDNSRWYCPDGFDNLDVDGHKDYQVHTGGSWMMKSDKITGFTSDKAPALTSNRGLILSSWASNTWDAYTKGVNGKPGVTKFTGDTEQQNPNNWFYQPAYGYYDGGEHSLSSIDYYGWLWLSEEYPYNGNHEKGSLNFRENIMGASSGDKVASAYPLFVQH